MKSTNTSKLSLFDAILMNMNIMIGGGVFVGPAMMAASAGNASFLAWPIAALIFLPLIVSLAQVMQLFPQGGGMFQYISSGLGTRQGFAGSWLFISSYSMIASIMLLCLYNATISSLGNTVITASRPVFYIAMISIIYFITLLPVSRIGMIQSYCTLIKLIPIMALIFFFLFQINFNFTVTTEELVHLPQAIIPWALFGFLGFESCCSVVHLIKDGEKNGIKALLFGFFGVVALYTFFHLGLLHVMGVENLVAQTASVFSRYILAPQPVISTLDFLILSSMIITFFASLLGLTFGNVSFFTTLVDKNLVQGGTTLQGNNLYNRPVKILALQVLIILTVALFCNDLGLLANYVNIAIFTGFISVFISLILQNKQAHRWGAILINILAIIVALSIILYSINSLGETITEKAFRMIPLLGINSLGFLLYKENH